MGFCLFNNIALAARHGQALGAERVLILDWDVHHGNGTQDIFWEDGSVLFCSTHQAPLYPGSGRREERGAGAGLDTTINCPLPAGSGGAQVLAALRQQVLPAVERFQPQLVLISAGFDAMAGDPLADLRLTPEDIGQLTALALEIADRHADGRLVSLLEGGYDLVNLAAGASAHVGALLGDPAPSLGNTPH